MRKENKWKGKLVLGAILVWVFYGGVMLSLSGTGLWVEEESDGWYVMAEECETDEVGTQCFDWEVDGPMTEAEAVAFVEADDKSGKELRDKIDIIGLTKLPGLLGFILYFIPCVIVYRKWDKINEWAEK